MAFQIPTLEDVLQRTRQAFKSNLPNSDPWIWPSNLYVTAKVIAERVWEAFHRLDWVKQQAFVLTATGENLDLHAQAYGVTRNAAVPATGSIVGTSGTAGTLIPAGTVLQNSDGTQYVTLEDATVDADGNVTFNVEALQTGPEGNLAGGAEVFFLTTLFGSPSLVSVDLSNIIDGGADVESDDSLRSRLLQRLQYPPHAGSRQDYIRWALEVEGVTRVWVSRNAYGPGSVGIWFTMDDSYEDGIPTAADVQDVQDYIDNLAPIAANAIVAAPVPEPVMIEITGFSPYNALNIERAKDELAAMIKEKAAVSTPTETNYIRRSWIWQAVSNSAGEEYHTVQLPQADVAASIGRLPVYKESCVTFTE